METERPAFNLWALSGQHSSSYPPLRTRNSIRNMGQSLANLDTPLVLERRKSKLHNPTQRTAVTIPKNPLCCRGRGRCVARALDVSDPTQRQTWALAGRVSQRLDLDVASRAGTSMRLHASGGCPGHGKSLLCRFLHLWPDLVFALHFTRWVTSLAWGHQIGARCFPFARSRQMEKG